MQTQNKYLLQLRNININITIFTRKLLNLPNHMVCSLQHFLPRDQKRIWELERILEMILTEQGEVICLTFSFLHFS